MSAEKHDNIVAISGWASGQLSQQKPQDKIVCKKLFEKQNKANEQTNKKQPVPSPHTPPNKSPETLHHIY